MRARYEPPVRDVTLPPELLPHTVRAILGGTEIAEGCMREFSIVLVDLMSTRSSSLTLCM